MKKELQPLPLSKLRPPQAGLRMSAGDKVNYPPPNETLSGAMKLFSPSAFSSRGLSPGLSGTPTGLLSGIKGLSPHYRSDMKRQDVTGLTPVDFPKMLDMSARDNLSARKFGRTDRGLTGNKRSNMNVNVLDDPINSDNFPWSPLFTDLSAKKTPGVDPLTTPKRPFSGLSPLTKEAVGNVETPKLFSSTGGTTPTAGKHGDLGWDLPSPMDRRRYGEIQMMLTASSTASGGARMVDARNDMLSPTDLRLYVVAGGNQSGPISSTMNMSPTKLREMEQSRGTEEYTADTGRTEGMSPWTASQQSRVLSSPITNPSPGRRINLETEEATSSRAGAENRSAAKGLGETESASPSSVKPQQGGLSGSQRNTTVKSVEKTANRQTVGGKLEGEVLGLETKQNSKNASMSSRTAREMGPPILSQVPKKRMSSDGTVAQQDSFPIPAAVANGLSPPAVNAVNMAGIPEGQAQAIQAQAIQAQQHSVQSVVPVQGTLMFAPAGMTTMPPTVSSVPQWVSTPSGKAPIPRASHASPEQCGDNSRKRSWTVALNDSKPRIIRNREAALRSREAARMRFQKLEEDNLAMKEKLQLLESRNAVMRAELGS